MTISHALRAVLRRWWAVVAVAVLAIAAAAAFALSQPAAYASTATVKINPAVLGPTTAATGVFIDTDPDVLTSPAVLDRIAATTGADRAALADGFTAEFAQTPTVQSQSATLLTIGAVAPTADDAQAWTAAFAQAYLDELSAQVDDARASLEQRRADAIAEAGAYQAQLAASPDDPIVSANLTSALAALASVHDALTTLDTWSTPAAVQQEAAAGASQATPLWTVLAIALVCGLIAGLGIVLVWDQFDDRIRREQDLAQLPGAPFLGALGYERTAARGQNPLPTAGAHSALGENLRALRTTLQVLLPAERQVVAISSVDPGDGKTFVSANLAVAWASAGRRVVVVGGDLRRPELTEYFGPRCAGPGLAELLTASRATGTAPAPEEVDALIVGTAHHDVHVLPAGHAAGDPADLLALPALTEIVERLADAADIVILDSPPAMVMADASLLARAAGAVVLLSSIGRTRKSDLTEVVQSLRSHGVSVLGVVGNRSRVRPRRNYAGYYGVATAPATAPMTAPATAHATASPPSGPPMPELRRHRRREAGSQA